MKVIFASLFLMLFSAIAMANEKEPFMLQVLIDQNSLIELVVDPTEFSSKEFELTEKLRLSVLVNPQNPKNIESVLYFNNKIIHSAVQAKNANSNPNFYLICSGELVQFISPFSGETPACPVPSNA